MRWSARLFFFFALAFIIYVFASGDDKEWRMIFTTKGYKVDPNAIGGSNVAPIATEADASGSGIPMGGLTGGDGTTPTNSSLLSQTEQNLYGATPVQGTALGTYRDLIPGAY